MTPSGGAPSLFLERLRPARRYHAVCALVAGVAAIFLAACSSTPRATFDLSPVSGRIAARAAQRQLAIPLPEATFPASSGRIVVRTDSQSVSYLEGAQWADTLPLLVQSRLIESFQNARLLRAVGRPGMLADFTLETTIRRFELDPSRGTATVEISAQLTAPSGRVAASRLFAASVPAPSSEPESAAAALNAAFGEVLREIVVWAASRM
jgi:cholesterol transport system auxiliary component